ncbi:DUF1707 SHOCT-like domain-containing protein [Rugosimonospora africana]|uniref:DUF1707 domain-containing protein n=1 Tax=Rugosimonospora africana TaxID=556532 RepID=A0A8J3R0F4_9ACTN|nr:DUF1707 domain-containing protein [Rugosimonospora africana]GIH17946.1 hypothetical protein Raf01_61180 [Rugosimonospora africana]
MTAQGEERESHRTRDEDRLRAADEDRQWVADRLRIALDQGRLRLAEYDDRLRLAYAATTYAELNALLDDLPSPAAAAASAVTPAPQHAPEPSTPSTSPGPSGKPYKRMPTALMVLWTIWGGVVAINLVVWLLVMVGTGEAIYPWPMWVAGPSGAALLAVTVGVQEIRRSKRR